MRVWRGNAEPLRWLFQESSAPSRKSPLLQSLIIQRRICFSCITIVLGAMVMWPAYAGRLHETLLAPLLPPNLIHKKSITFYETWILSLYSSKEHIKNVSKDPIFSQEYPHCPKLQQSVTILLEGLWLLHIWNLKLKLIVNKRTHQECNQRLQPQLGEKTHHPDSSRMSSFFRRVLATFKHDLYLLNFKHMLIVIEETH